MTKNIFKFEMKYAQSFKVYMPKDAKILSIGKQNGVIQMWALVDPANDYENRYFECYGTGHDIDCSPEIKRTFLDTDI